jgi:hypothetical protein
MLTEKENYLMCLRGEQPEWVPVMHFGSAPDGRVTSTRMVAPSFLHQGMMDTGKSTDIWGVTSVPVVEAGGSKIPEPGNFILKDIRKWRDVIKAPDVSYIDWEQMAKDDLNKANINRKESAVIYDMNCGFFQLLMSFMGFSEGLCAMVEEPEEVQALFEYVSDFYYKINLKCFHLYEPDAFYVVDDTATWRNSFISLALYRELLKPHHAKHASIGANDGLPGDMHNCGRCEEFIDEWKDFGIVAWNPAQTCNDLLAIKKKYGNSVIIEGGWDAREELLDLNVTEDAIRASVYKTIDALAPGGGYVFCGGYLGPLGDETTAQRNKWLMDAVYEYGTSFYKK